MVWCIVYTSTACESRMCYWLGIWSNLWVPKTVPFGLSAWMSCQCMTQLCLLNCACTITDAWYCTSIHVSNTLAVSVTLYEHVKSISCKSLSVNIDTIPVLAHLLSLVVLSISLIPVQCIISDLKQDHTLCICSALSNSSFIIVSPVGMFWSIKMY